MRVRIGLFAGLLVAPAVTCSVLGRVAYEAQPVPVVYVTATPAADRSPPYPNRVFVLDAETGKVIPDAWLVIDGAAYPVDGRGFTVSLRTGTVEDVLIGAPGYESERRRLQLGPDHPVTAVCLQQRP